MPNDETKTIPPVEIGPEDLDRILRKFEEDMMKEEELKKGNNPYKSSMIDKPIDEPDRRGRFLARVYKNLVESDRATFDKGGRVLDPIDQEILELEMFVGLRPLDGYEAYLISNMQDRLDYLYELKQKGKK